MWQKPLGVGPARRSRRMTSRPQRRTGRGPDALVRRSTDTPILYRPFVLVGHAAAHGRSIRHTSTINHWRKGHHRWRLFFTIPCPFLTLEPTSVFFPAIRSNVDFGAGCFLSTSNFFPGSARKAACCSFWPPSVLASSLPCNPGKRRLGTTMPLWHCSPPQYSLGLPFHVGVKVGRDHFPMSIDSPFSHSSTQIPYSVTLEAKGQDGTGRESSAVAESHARIPP